MEKKLNPVSPGEVLLEEFLKPMGISQNHLALKIGVPARRINEIVLGKRRITADTALRLARFFGTLPGDCGQVVESREEAKSDRLMIFPSADPSPGRALLRKRDSAAGLL